jgi:hypothetical protein
MAKGKRRPKGAAGETGSTGAAAAPGAVEDIVAAEDTSAAFDASVQDQPSNPPPAPLHVRIAQMVRATERTAPAESAALHHVLVDLQAARRKAAHGLAEHVVTPVARALLLEIETL